MAGVACLRDKWRVVGGLIGALPSQPRQNAQLGLPLKLLPEETTLLLELGILIRDQYGRTTPFATRNYKTLLRHVL